MTLELDFGALSVGQELVRTAIGSPLVGLLPADYEGWLEDMLEEIEDRGERFGVAFERIGFELNPLSSGETRVTGILRVVAIDEDLREQEAGLFGVIILLGVLLAGAWTFNVAGVREDSLELAKTFFGAAPTIAISFAVVAVAALLALLLLRLEAPS